MIRTRIHVTIVVESTEKPPGTTVYGHEWSDVAKTETRIDPATNAEEAAQMSVLDAFGAACRMAGVRFSGPEDIIERAHEIAGVEPDGEARTAGDVAAFLSEEDDEPAPHIRIAGGEPVQYEGMTVPEAVALTHGAAPPEAGDAPDKEWPY